MEITRTTAHWEVKTKTKNGAVVVLVVLVIVAIADVIYMPLGETAMGQEDVQRNVLGVQK